LQPGLVLAVGPNRVGKTNLLESLHVGTQGLAPRTRAGTQLIRFGASAAPIAARGRRVTVPLDIEVIIEGGAGKRAQRNASRRRVAAGFSSRDALARWTVQVAELGTALVGARREALALLGPPFAERAGELGLADAELRYDGEPPTVAMLEERLDRDLERGVTGAGPHLDDIVLASGTRELRSFGSQGEQRLAVLALLLAEAELIADRRGVPPLLLLDDVLSELDPARRRILAARVATAGQALITATDPAMLPAEPGQLLEVTPGEVHDRSAR